MSKEMESERLLQTSRLLRIAAAGVILYALRLTGPFAAVETLVRVLLMMLLASWFDPLRPPATIRRAWDVRDTWYWLTAIAVLICGAAPLVMGRTEGEAARLVALLLSAIGTDAALPKETRIASVSRILASLVHLSALAIIVLGIGILLR